MAARVSRILGTYDTLFAAKSNLNNTFQEIVDYVLPNKSNINRFESPGIKRGTRRYDQTAVEAAELLSSSMSSSITNPSIDWHKFAIRDDAFNSADDVKIWLEVCTELWLAALHDSNFYTQIDEAYLDIAGFGTTAILTQELAFDRGARFTGLQFETWGAGEYVFLESSSGDVDTVYRKFSLRPGQALEKFQNLPRFQGLGDKVEKALDSKDEGQRLRYFDFLHCIQPRKDRDPTIATSLNFPIESTYISCEDKHLISEGGFEELPVAVARWRKAKNDDDGWGRSPGMTAMPTIRTLNEAQRLELKAWAKDIDPPLVTESRGVIGNINVGPGGVTFKKRGAELDYLVSGGKYDISAFKKEEARRSIETVFGVDQLKRLAGEPQPNMTLGEFVRRVQIMQKLLGSTFGRIQRELLTPIVSRGFAIMLRRGAFPPVPKTLVDAASAGFDITLDIEYVGALARAQQSEDLPAVQELYQFAALQAQSTGDVAVFDRINHDATLQLWAERRGVPTRVMRTDAEYLQIQEARQQAAAQAAQAEALQQVAGGQV